MNFGGLKIIFERNIWNTINGVQALLRGVVNLRKEKNSSTKIEKSQGEPNYNPLSQWTVLPFVEKFESWDTDLKQNATIITI